MQDHASGLYADRAIAIIRAHFEHKVALYSLNAFGAAAPAKVGIAKSVFDDLQRYAKYSVTAYKDLEDCVKPLNNTVLHRYDKKSTQGFLVRDDVKKEFILAFRGTEPTKGDGDCSIDLSICKTNLSLPLVESNGAKVHTGFQKAWGYVSEQVTQDLMKELKSKPGYRVVVTGHSLGGALAAVSSLQIKKTFPKLALKMFSYGAPRVGDLAFVKTLEKTLGAENIYRGSNLQGITSIELRSIIAEPNHSRSGVIPPTFAAELPPFASFFGYWLSKEPASAGNVMICTHGEDKDETTDKTCNNVPVVVNPANIAQHSSLFGITTSNAKQYCGGGAAGVSTATSQRPGSGKKGKTKKTS
ncbi:hypothetical protein ONZ45_g3769 [Pleurotus djamor]|nr:hypothetical protein ONZ45_g3769 [Pleurotus djamor]